MIAEITSASTQSAAQAGLGLGSMIAVVCSWERNRSVLMAIVAGVLSWIYVIYFVLVRRKGERPKDWDQE